jgi:hypothetical protein
MATTAATAGAPLPRGTTRVDSLPAAVATMTTVAVEAGAAGSATRKVIPKHPGAGGTNARGRAAPATPTMTTGAAAAAIRRRPAMTKDVSRRGAPGMMIAAEATAAGSAIREAIRKRRGEAGMSAKAPRAQAAATMIAVTADHGMTMTGVAAATAAGRAIPKVTPRRPAAAGKIATDAS